MKPHVEFTMELQLWYDRQPSTRWNRFLDAIGLGIKKPARGRRAGKKGETVGGNNQHGEYTPTDTDSATQGGRR